MSKTISGECLQLEHFGLPLFGIFLAMDYSIRWRDYDPGRYMFSSSSKGNILKRLVCSCHVWIVSGCNLNL